MNETVRETVDAMRSTPALLAVVLLQFATLAGLYFVSTGNADRMHTREMALIARCGPQEGS